MAECLGVSGFPSRAISLVHKGTCAESGPRTQRGGHRQNHLAEDRSAVSRVVQDSLELRRILALPRRPQEHDEDLAAELTRHLRRPNGGQTLRAIQATALHEAWRTRGLFGPIGVGEGKTLVTLLVPLVLGLKAPVLLTKAKLLEKTRRDMVELNRHWKIPNHIRMYSYETLGRADHVHLLRRHPLTDGIIADECHALRNASAAVSRRVKRHFDEYPDTPFIGLSGSICKRSIRDYGHLIRWALKSGAPLPQHHGELEDWADALDEHDRERPEPGALVLFSDGETDLLSVRRGYQRRLVETPGVVSSIRNRISASLLIRGVRYPQGPAIAEAFALLRDKMELPDGTELISGMEVWRHARELALGFWGRWDPPAPEAWLAPRRAWGRRLWEILGRSRTLDSELHVIRAIDAGDRRDALAGAQELLATWRAVKDSFEPNPVPVWIDDQPLEFAAAWARSHTGIVWCDHVPFAVELAKRTKLTYYGRKGEDSEGHLLDQHVGTCIASRQSGAEGFNLQRWSEALVTAVVANGIQTEQLLGRHHRPGQDDDVVFDLMLGCREHLESFWKARADAEFERDTMGAEAKILYADVDVDDVNDSAPQWRNRCET